MGEQRESSLLFSLNQLFAHERDRVRLKRAAEDARLAEEQALHEENVRRIREAELQTEMEEARRKVAEDQRKREEAIRLEVLRTAELERVRAEVDKNSQVEQAMLELEHQRRMDALARTSEQRRQRAMTLTSVLLGAAVVAGCLGVYFGKLRPEQHRVLAGYEAVLGARTAQLVEAERQLSALKTERTRLRAELSAVRQVTHAPIDTTAASHPRAPSLPGSKRGTASRPPADPKLPKMDPNDPMNPSL